MKRITLCLFLLVFTCSISAQEIPVVKNLASIDKIVAKTQIDRNLNSFNSTNLLAPLSLNKKANRTAYKPKEFNFSIIPYAWFNGIGGTVGYYEDQKFSFNKSFSDAVKYLKMAVAGTAKFKYRRVSLVFDISYINLKGFGTEIPANTPHILSANWTMKQTLYDIFLTYLLPSKSKSAMVDIYAGTRIWALNSEVTVLDSNNILTMKAADKTWVDPVIGVNSEFVLDSKMKWFAYAKGDIGGFSVNSQMTWQLAGGAGYNITPNFPVYLGIKYVGVNYDKDAFNWTVNEYGLVLGIGYKY